MLINKLRKGMKNPTLFLSYIFGRRIVIQCAKILPDDQYLKIKYRLIFNKRLNLDNPQTFNEKLQWLKLYDCNPDYVKLVDKFEVRKHISTTVGDNYLIPLIGTYDSVEDIRWETLPNKFVLKCTHGSGSNIICNDKGTLNRQKTIKQLNKWMRLNWFWYGREWPYKDIKPRIICEEFLVDESGYELKDYKIYCYHGEPKIIQVMSNRSKGGYNLNHYDLDWNEIIIERKNHKPNPNLAKPILLQEMVEVSRKLSKDIPFVRVDLYYTGEKIYFGEMTFFPASGYIDYVKESDDLLHGSWLDLSKVKNY